MESEWYLKVADKEVGPLAPRQLKTMADRGQISPYDPVRLGIHGHWVPASSVRGLLPAGGLAAKQPALGGLPVAEQLQKPPAALGVMPDAEPEPAAALASTTPPGIPVAQPVAPPVAATPVPRASGASSPGPFAVEAGQSTVVGPSAGRRRRSAAGSHRRRKQEAMIVAGVMVVMALAAVSAAVMLSGKGATRTSNGPQPAENVSRDIEPEHEEVVIPGLDEYLGEVGLDSSGSRRSGGVPSRRARSEGSAAEAWTDASTSSAECGDVSVKITCAQIAFPRLVSRASGMAARGAKECLCLKLELRNRSEAKAREYRRWRVEDPGVTLVDDRDERYAIKSFAGRGLEIDGQIEGGKASLSPGQATEEVLVFERPTKRAALLRLRLPASAFGEEGSLKFEIPISMIAVADASQDSGPSEASGLAAEGTAGRRPEPGSAQAAQPVYDGGPIPIPGVTGRPSREAADGASSAAAGLP